MTAADHDDDNQDDDDVTAFACPICGENPCDHLLVSMDDGEGPGLCIEAGALYDRPEIDAVFDVVRRFALQSLRDPREAAVPLCIASEGRLRDYYEALCASGFDASGFSDDEEATEALIDHTSNHVHWLRAFLEGLLREELGWSGPVTREVQNPAPGMMWRWLNWYTDDPQGLADRLCARLRSIAEAGWAELNIRGG